jgi:DNA-binding CsgD family transcriptional regulator
MRRSAARDVRAAITDAGRRALEPVALERAVAGQLRRAVPFDLWCGLTTDPATGDPTGGYHEEGLPPRRLTRLLEIENGAIPDFVAIRTLTRGGASVRTLSDATDGDLQRSPRYRDVLAPSGVRHEVRVALRCGGGTWGALVLMRGSDLPDFTPAEVRLLATVGPVIGEGVRRSAVLGRRPSGSPDAPGLVLCTVADGVTVDAVSASASRWLAELDDGVAGGLPYAVTCLVHTVRSGPTDAGPRRTRMRTRTGQWLTVHAERLGPSLVSLVLEPARPREVAELWADAHGLTARERDVAGLAVRGLTNAEIAGVLFLSPYTVQDHLKQVFERTGVAGRTELAAALFLGAAADPLPGSAPSRRRRATRAGAARPPGPA